MTIAEASKRLREGASAFAGFRLSPDGEQCWFHLPNAVVLKYLDADPDKEDAECACDLDPEGDLIFDLSK